MLIFIIAGIVIIGVIFLIIFIRRKKEQRELEYYHYEHYGRWERYSIEALEKEILRIRNKKDELQRRLEAFARAAPKVVIGKNESSGFDDVESQMLDIRWQLEGLDSEEDDISQVLRDKKSK
jgi:hypothetical protein